CGLDRSFRMWSGGTRPRARRHHRFGAPKRRPGGAWTEPRVPREGTLVGGEGGEAKGGLRRRGWSGGGEQGLCNVGRREASEALGLNFGRIRALRRIARAAMTMGELAAALGVDAPYATLVVDALEGQGLVERQPHPTDRRVKIVVVTSLGASFAERAEAI